MEAVAERIEESGQAAAPVLSQDEWRARAETWEFMALSLRCPTIELADAVAAGEWASTAREITEVFNLAPSDRFLAGVFQSACDDKGNVCDSEALFHRLRAEQTRLFVGAPEAIVSPYEGVWRAEDDGVEPLLFVNPHSMDVERFIRKCGLSQPEDANEPFDQVATELELLEYLALVASGEAGAVEGAELPGGSAAAAYDRFLNEHVRAWMPRFAKALGEETRLPFYRNVADLLGAVIR